MCPVCLATAAWIAVAAVSTGGVTALVLKKVVVGEATSNIPKITPNKEDRHD